MRSALRAAASATKEDCSRSVVFGSPRVEPFVDDEEDDEDEEDNEDEVESEGED